MGYDLEFVNKGPVLNGGFVGESIESSLDYVKLADSTPRVSVERADPERVYETLQEWTYEYREFWFRNKSYGAWVTVGTSKQAFNTLSAGYAMENLIGKD